MDFKYTTEMCSLIISFVLISYAFIPGTNALTDYVTVLNPPDILRPNVAVDVKYQCKTIERVMGLNVQISTDTVKNKRVFQYTWTCIPKRFFSVRTIPIKLGPEISYRPDVLNKKSINVIECFIKVWTLEKSVFERVDKKKLGPPFEFAVIKKAYRATVPSPYSRPRMPVRDCTTWWFNVVREAERLNQLHCPAKLDSNIVKMLKFPVAFSGWQSGMHYKITDFVHKAKQKTKRSTFRQVRFSVAIWLYVIDYCPSPGGECSILHRLTVDGEPLTPLVYFTKQGNIYIKVFTSDDDHLKHCTKFRVPKYQWCHILISIESSQISVSLSCDRHLSKVKKDSLRFDDDDDLISFNDRRGIFVIGGSELVHSFKGYVAEVTLYRKRRVQLNKIQPPSIFAPMFSLELDRRSTECDKYLSLVEYRIKQCKFMMRKIIRKKSCLGVLDSLIKKSTQAKMNRRCHILSKPRNKRHRIMNSMVRKMVFRRAEINMQKIGKTMYKKVMDNLAVDGIRRFQKVIPLIKQSSCLGFHDASFLLAAVLNHGVGVKVDESKAASYLLRAGLENHRLSLLALGNKHFNGLDNFPLNYDMSYVYYKQVASQTIQDREEHKGTDVATEAVRLTDEEEMESQTDESGDLFHWLKYEARQGILDAQQNLARMLYYGSQGLKRNVDEAANYYRMAAEAEERDPVALYDYGIVLLYGRGVKKNKTKALRLLKEAASMDHLDAINALGWYALEEGDMKNAYIYLKKAYENDHPQAAHNLGHMFANGLVPGKPADMRKAIDYFSFAATEGLSNSAVVVAMFHIRGHLTIRRDAKEAAAWSRFVAEKNPSLGKILRLGLHKYRDMNWSAALLYYLLAAEAGIEQGNFNLAFICEQNAEGLISYMSKECAYRHFNLSIQRDGYKDPYAFLRMGDYHYYGLYRPRDLSMAAEMYARAALRDELQGIFNLAVMVSEGHKIPEKVVSLLNLTHHTTDNNMALLVELYLRCSASRSSDAYVPCRLALMNAQISYFFNYYYSFIVYFFVGSATAAVTGFALRYHRRQRYW